MSTACMYRKDSANEDNMDFILIFGPKQMYLDMS